MHDPDLLSNWPIGPWANTLHTQVLSWLSHLPAPVADILLRTEASDWFLIAMSPVFLFTVLLEVWHLRQTKIYAWRDSMASINLGNVYLGVDILWLVFWVLPAMNWLYAHRLWHFEMTPWRFVLLYLGVELCYYWFHRSSHRIRWFWCAHVVHHGSEHMNFTAAVRQSAFYSLAGNWWFYLPMVIVGYSPRWVLLALSINLAYQFFVHTQWVGRLPAWIEWVFNTPSHHRAHHGRNAQYIDRNFGGTFIVFDRLFGTFEPERDPVDYGLVRQVHSTSVLWLNLHEWVYMFQGVCRRAPLAVRLKYIWGPPEWQDPALHP